MTTATLNVKMDAEGFMTDPNEWTQEIADIMAVEEDIAPLTERHWVVINFVRDQFAKTGDFPSLRSIGKQSGVDTKELYALFPKGPAKKVARVSGFGKPKGCI